MWSRGPVLRLLRPARSALPRRFRRAARRKVAIRASPGFRRRCAGRESTAPNIPACLPICGAPKSRGWRFYAINSTRCSRKWRGIAISSTWRLRLANGPRLFIDVIGFVEMSRDRRGYRFLQDTRHGRIVIAETDKVETMVEAITAYMAHRLIEREKALAVDYASGGAASLAGARAAAIPSAVAKREQAPWSRKAFQIFLFVMEFLGSAVFFSFIAVLGFWLYRTYIAS